MKKLSKILSVGLSLAMCASLAAPALAVTYDISKGNVTVTADGSTGWDVDKGELASSTDKEITVTGTTTENTITVGDGVTDTTITLSGVNIDVSGTGDPSSDHRKHGEAAFSISGKDSKVTVELDGENTLKSGYDRAGLELNDRASVSIQDENRDGGSLTAVKGKDGGAGIGSGYHGTAGNITINGGTVVAEGNSNGAAIGSGQSAEVGNITINGGTVTASSENGGWGAGIGTGEGVKNDESKCGKITINGGDVTAKGGAYSAGIGTGPRSECKEITITGGTVTAIGNDNSAGIGSGWLTSGSNKSWTGDITIRGGNVTAIGGVAGSGIGTGVHDKHPADTSGSKVGNIAISNSDPDHLLALSASGLGAHTNETLSGAAVSCRLADSVTIDENSSTFAVYDMDGKLVREFSVYVDGTAYRAFAIELPESNQGYVIAQKDENGKIIGYLADKDNEIVVFNAETDGDSVKAVERDGLKLGNACPHGKNPATCEKCNPPEEEKCPHGNDPKTCEECNKSEEEKCPHGNDPKTCEECNKSENPDPVDPDPVDPDPAPVTDPIVEIDDVEVPLASGPVTRAEFIDYLWRHEGEPVADGVCTFADVAEDHEFALALAWAEEAGIAVADADGNFRPDDLLLRSTEDAEGELQEFLNRYAVYAGIRLEDGELFYELDGEPDSIVMGQEVLAIFADFFARLEAAQAKKAA